ncbi:hypothetical protein GCM10018790_37830 [Kitasatospora xanthocidica]|nr:hypothetical protein GCM10018790_37830 [Kitasatospora xanthocidica]
MSEVPTGARRACGTAAVAVAAETDGVLRMGTAFGARGIGIPGVLLTRSAGYGIHRRPPVVPPA